MDKPRAFIHWSEDEVGWYSLGYLHFGRVSVPSIVPIVLLGVLASLCAVVGFSLNILALQLVFIGTLLLFALGVVIFGLSALVIWVRNTIRVDGKDRY